MLEICLELLDKSAVVPEPFLDLHVLVLKVLDELHLESLGHRVGVEVLLGALKNLHALVPGYGTVNRLREVHLLLDLAQLCARFLLASQAVRLSSLHSPLLGFGGTSSC